MPRPCTQQGRDRVGTALTRLCPPCTAAAAFPAATARQTEAALGLEPRDHPAELDKIATEAAGMAEHVAAAQLQDGLVARGEPGCDRMQPRAGARATTAQSTATKAAAATASAATRTATRPAAACAGTTTGAPARKTAA